MREGINIGVSAADREGLAAVVADRKHPAKAAMGSLSGGSGAGFAYLPVPGQELL